MIEHPLEPIIDEQCEVLILGSFPSVKSREISFYYGHPQNRFWKIIGTITQTDYETIEDKKKDVIGTSYCDMGYYPLMYDYRKQ